MSSGAMDGELVCGVVTLDVEGRIGLGIAEPLGVGQHLVEGDTLRLHARQYVVAGTVHDAEDAADRVAGQRLAHGLDDGNAAGDCRLVVEQHALLLRRLCELQPVARKQRLVGGDDVTAGLQRGLHALARSPLLAADQLDIDVDAARAREVDRIIEPFGAGKVDAAVAAPVARANGRDDQRPAALARQLGRLVGQHPHHRRTHRSQPGYPNAQCFAHAPGIPSLSSVSNSLSAARPAPRRCPDAAPPRPGSA
jgi:hypothetical protein